MIKELAKLANHLDRIGLVKEADYVDDIIKKAEIYPKGHGPLHSTLQAMEIPEFYRFIKFYEDFGPNFHEAWKKAGDTAEILAINFHHATTGLGTKEAMMAAVIAKAVNMDILDDFRYAYSALAERESSILTDDYGDVREAIKSENSGQTEEVMLDLLDKKIMVKEIGKGRSLLSPPGRITSPPGGQHKITISNGKRFFTMYHEGNSLGMDYVSTGEPRSGTNRSDNVPSVLDVFK